MLTIFSQARKLLHLICYPAGVPSSIGGLITNSNDMETVHEAASRILQVSGFVGDVNILSAILRGFIVCCVKNSTTLPPLLCKHICQIAKTYARDEEVIVKAQFLTKKHE